MTVAAGTNATTSGPVGSRKSIVTRSVREAKRQWLWGYTLAFVVLLYLPSVFILIFSFNSGIHIAFPLKEWTTNWYVQLSQDGALLEAAGNSLKVASAASFFSTVIGTLGAFALVRYRWPGGQAITGLGRRTLPGAVLAGQRLCLVTDVLADGLQDLLHVPERVGGVLQRLRIGQLGGGRVVLGMVGVLARDGRQDLLPRPAAVVRGAGVAVAVAAAVRHAVRAPVRHTPNQRDISRATPAVPDRPGPRMAARTRRSLPAM